MPSPVSVVFYVSRVGVVDLSCASSRAVARTLIGGGGVYMGGYARLTSFEINCVSKETSWAEPEYMNIHPPINVLATALASRVFFWVLRFSSLPKINISRQYVPAVNGTCCCGDPTLVAKLNIKK